MPMLDGDLALAGLEQAAGGIRHVDDPKAWIKHHQAVAHMLQAGHQSGHFPQDSVLSPSRLRSALAA